MKYLGCLLLFLNTFFLFSQDQANTLETFPIFPGCADVPFSNEEACFKNQLLTFITSNFNLPQKVIDEKYKGEMAVLFEVDRKGIFKVIYVDAIYPELKEEIIRVFDQLPQIEPATYNGKPTFAQFRMPLQIPLDPLQIIEIKTDSIPVAVSVEKPAQVIKPIAVAVAVADNEYDSITSLPFEYKEPESNLRIPFSHELYSRFDAAMNRIGTNAHTASKPFLYSDVADYYDFELERAQMMKDVNSYLGRKLWNEHLIVFQGEDHWFTGDIILDLQIGKDFGSEFDFTYNNTRGAVFQGGLGENLNFYTVVFESQGRFADYYNRYAESLAPFMGSGVAIVPGRGIAKDFMDWLLCP